jgi:phospholipid/cholesterol/gamma-HCH transport system substrate-binding protein
MAKQEKRSFWASIAFLGRNKNPFETIVGFAVLFIAFYFLAWGIFTARTNVSGYTLVTNFPSVGGLARGADVAVNGVKIGAVSEMRLDPNDYSVDVIMSIDSRYLIPKDSVARITTSGLIGDKYVAISTGSSPEHATMLDKLKSAQYKSLEETIGDMIYK